MGSHSVTCHPAEVTFPPQPEVRDALYCRRRRFEPSPHATSTECLVKFGHADFEIRERIDRHADRNTSQDTIRYDTRCYFNVRSKADMSQLNLQHATSN